MMNELNKQDRDIETEAMMEYIKQEDAEYFNVVVNILGRVLDQDGDGKITRTEMESFLLNLPDKMTDQELERFLESVDVHGKGFVLIEGL